MQKDFKIGLGVGLLFVIGMAFWLSTRPDLSTEARTLYKSSNAPPVYSSRDESTQYAVRNTSNEQPPARVHVVQKGETLSSIAAKYYGLPAQWPRILAANKSTLTDPNHLLPGSKLIIPE